MLSDFTKLATMLGNALQKKSLTLSTAESCTGGLAAKLITDISGSSAWFDRGFVAYNNAAKQEMLDVNQKTLKQFGSMSEETVKEMAEGALKHSHAEVSLAITGIAGPSGGTTQNPVGTVFFAWAGQSFKTKTHTEHFTGNREKVRKQAVFFALQRLLEYIQK